MHPAASLWVLPLLDNTDTAERAETVSEEKPEIPLLPTPTAADADRGPDYARTDRDGSGGDDLLTVILKLQKSGET